MTAHRLGLADAGQAADGLRHKGEGDGNDHPSLVEGARREPHQVAHGRHLVEDGEAGEDDGQHEAVLGAKGDSLQRDRPAQQREPARQTQEHRLTDVNGQTVEQGGERDRYGRESQR